MALKFKLDASAFDALEESAQAMYKKDGNVYLLDVEGIDDSEAAGLKLKLETLMTEKKDLERKAREDSAAAIAKSESDAKAAGDYKALYESLNAKYADLEGQHTGLKGEIKKGAINSEASRIAGTLTKDTARAQLLAEKIASRLSHTDDGIKVLDQSGNLTVSSMDELSTQIKTAYPFLVDGSQASGGAANGSRGGASDSKKITRADFDQLDHLGRSEFVKGGGSVTDE